jgi:hypothetical protein
MDWRDRAACRDEDPELHFPVGVSGPALLQIAEAKTVCRRCRAHACKAVFTLADREFLAVSHG